MRKRPGDKTTDGILDESSKRQRVSYVSHKELTRLRAIANGNAQSTTTIEVTDPTYDPWDVSRDAQDQVIDPRFTFLTKSKKKVAPKTITHKPISLAASGKAVPAIKAPTGGHSYNPDFSEYEARLTAMGNKELLAEQKRIKAAEAELLKAELTAKSAAEADAAEARGDLSEWEEDSAWEGFESGAEDARLKAKRPERKTQVQRNKIKRRKAEEQKQKMAAEIKRRNEEAQHIKKYAQEIKERDAARAAALEEAKEDSEGEGDDMELRRRKLGKIPLPEQNLELVLPDELQDSLRLLKPEGNALGDRYRSILVRGKVETRRPISFSKKAKRKATEKWTHKDFMLH